MNVYRRLQYFARNLTIKIDALVLGIDNQQKQLNRIIELQRQQQLQQQLDTIIQGIDNQQKQLDRILELQRQPLDTIIELQKAQLVMARDQVEAIDALAATQAGSEKREL